MIPATSMAKVERRIWRYPKIRSFLQALGLIGLHGPVLTAPAVPGALGDAEVADHLGEASELDLCGALGENRTPNLLIRSQMLYPLSYERSVVKTPPILPVARCPGGCVARLAVVASIQMSDGGPLPVPPPPLDPWAMTLWSRDAYGADGRLALPRVAHWPIFPFETDGLRTRCVEDPVLPEASRHDEDPDHCATCALPDGSFIWTDERWRISMPSQPWPVPTLSLHTRAHLSSSNPFPSLRPCGRSRRKVQRPWFPPPTLLD